MMRIAAAILVFLLAPLGSAERSGFFRWSGDQLREFEETLAPKMNASKSASQQLANLGSHIIQINHREAGGEAEVHENVTDIFVVQTGEATLAIGGKLENGKTTALGELRGSSLAGAESMNLSPGDIVNIPAGMPHQVLLAEGKQFTYLIIKIQSSPQR
jgi:mannose-6-phosphate isomerase-like protein (cupin superfamily)